MPQRKITLVESVEGGYSWQEEGIKLDPKTNQPMQYINDGVRETPEGMLEMMEKLLGAKRK